MPAVRSDQVLGEYLFIDFETTDLDAGVGCVVQVAAIAMSCDLKHELDRYHALVISDAKSLSRADPKAMAMNGYDEKRWKKKALTPQAAFSRISLMGKGRRLAGHNVSFDISFFKAGLKRCFLEPLPNRPQPMCTRVLLMPLLAAGLVPSISLAKACAHLGIELEHHNPISDCLASIEIARYVFDFWRAAEMNRHLAR